MHYFLSSSNIGTPEPNCHASSNAVVSLTSFQTDHIRRAHPAQVNVAVFVGGPRQGWASGLLELRMEGGPGNPLIPN